VVWGFVRFLSSLEEGNGEEMGSMHLEGKSREGKLLLEVISFNRKWNG
jgi:hypothetical protein